MELWGSEVTGFVPSAEPFSFRHLVENRLPQKRGTLWGRGEGGKAGDGGWGEGWPCRSETPRWRLAASFGPCLQMPTP